MPRGTVTSLRVITYHFGYIGLAGPDCIGYGGPWEVMRILGTVPLEADGSAFFRVPANTPIALQPLDAEGKAVQLMRSWFTVMPGEKASCVGCHERPSDAPRSQVVRAARREPRVLTPWFGPARGFDFEREVQPVLDRHCVRCHDGRASDRGANVPSALAPPPPAQRLEPDCGTRVEPVPGARQVARSADRKSPMSAAPDLRTRAVVTNYVGRRISQMGIDRLHPKIRANTQGIFKYAPAYDALLAYLRRVGIEDDVSLLIPAEYHADTSPLIQLLRKGHHGVRLEAEDWDRLVTWIDLNAPCHGTWGEVHPIPDGAHERRMALRRRFGGPTGDPENIPPPPRTNADRADFQTAARPGSTGRDLSRESSTETRGPAAESERGAPADERFALRNRALAVAESRISELPPGPRGKVIELGHGITLKLVRIPAGEFTMGDPAGADDEQPATRVTISKPFWMAACEISNEQFRQFDSGHDSRYYQKRYPAGDPGAPNWVGPDTRGLTLNGDRQPVVRVSWEQAMAFCRWLSARTGRRFTLPTEAQWEWACRAGTTTPFNFGAFDADFALWANLADASFSKGLGRDGKQITGGLEHLVLEGAALSDARFHDGAVVTADVGRYRPNAWGLHDMHGNVAEWTRSAEAPYPYRDDTRNDERPGGRKVVRGGSFFDPPGRSRSAFRLAYPSWQRVFNVGFRVVMLEEEGSPLAAAPSPALPEPAGSHAE